MKLNNFQIQKFIESPNKETPIIIIYGPDEGLCKEYVSVLIKNFGFKINDPFETSIIDSGDFETFS